MILPLRGLYDVQASIASHGAPRKRVQQRDLLVRYIFDVIDGRLSAPKLEPPKKVPSKASKKHFPKPPSQKRPPDKKLHEAVKHSRSSKPFFATIKGDESKVSEAVRKTKAMGLSPQYIRFSKTNKQIEWVASVELQRAARLKHKTALEALGWVTEPVNEHL